MSHRVSGVNQSAWAVSLCGRSARTTLNYWKVKMEEIAEVERRFRDSSRALLDPANNEPLACVLRKEFDGLRSAYVLHWIPEQGEDIYEVVVGPETLAVIEIPKPELSSDPPIIERVRLKRCLRQRRGGVGRRKLERAIRLAKEDATEMTDRSKGDQSV